MAQALLLLVALICFLVGASAYPAKLNMTSLGLVFLTMAELLRILPR